jgi:hypothetical protein
MKLNLEFDNPEARGEGPGFGLHLEFSMEEVSR